MTEVEAREQLKLLRRDECNCGCDRLRVFYHEAGCRYRVLAFCSAVWKPYVGRLYTDELPQAA